MRARCWISYGYVDRDGDGWREQPDGSPLVLEIATESSQIDRAFNEIWKRQLDRARPASAIQVNQWPENLKNARAGRLMMWRLGKSATQPDPDDFLAFGSSNGNIGSVATSPAFSSAGVRQLYELQKQMADGAERDATDP